MTDSAPTLRNSWRLSVHSVDLRRPDRPSRPVVLDALPQELTLDFARTAMLVIDMQNDFLSNGGWLDSIGVDVSAARMPIGPLQRTLPVLRRQGLPIVWVNWGNRADGANLPPNVRHVYDPDGAHTGINDLLPNGSAVLRHGSWSAAIVDDLEVCDEDLHVAKYRMSGFWDTPLDSILRNLRVDTLLFAGVNVDQCVYATLIDAACLGYDTVLVDDLCGTTSPAFCAEATRYNVRQCFGFTCTSTGLLAACHT